MTSRSWTMAASIAIAAVAGTLGMQHSSAQAPAGFKRVELQKHDLSTPGREALLARAEFQPGAVVPKHTHPGEEVGYVLEGELTIEVDGKPTVTLKAGESYFIPAGTVHAGKNTGKGTSAVVSTYIVEKGKPLATPVK
jgi:quercetin dioxygenase-like cupin family protein